MNVSGIKAYNLSPYNDLSKIKQPKPQLQAQQEMNDVAFQGLGRRVAGGAALALVTAAIALGSYRVGTIKNDSNTPMKNLEAISSVSNSVLPATIKNESLKELTDMYFSNVKTEVNGSKLMINAQYNPYLYALNNANDVKITLEPSEDDPNKYVGKVVAQVPDENSTLFDFDIPFTDVNVSSTPTKSNLKEYDFAIQLLEPEKGGKKQDFRVIVTIDGQNYLYHTTKKNDELLPGETIRPLDPSVTLVPQSPTKHNVVLDPLASLALTALFTAGVWGVGSIATGGKKSKD